MYNALFSHISNIKQFFCSIKLILCSQERLKLSLQFIQVDRSALWDTLSLMYSEYSQTSHVLHTSEIVCYSEHSLRLSEISLFMVYVELQATYMPWKKHMLAHRRSNTDINTAGDFKRIAADPCEQLCARYPSDLLCNSPYLPAHHIYEQKNKYKSATTKHVRSGLLSFLMHCRSSEHVETCSTDGLRVQITEQKRICTCSVLQRKGNILFLDLRQISIVYKRLKYFFQTLFSVWHDSSPKAIIISLENTCKLIDRSHKTILTHATPLTVKADRDLSISDGYKRLR